MVIKISKVFLKEDNSQTIIQIKLSEPKKIVRILEEIGFEASGYAEFYLNNKKVNKDAFARDEDKLLILPIVGGG